MRNLLIFGGIGLAMCTNFAARAQPSDIIKPGALDSLRASGKEAPDSLLGGWSGSGEIGYSSSRGNSRVDNLNVKLNAKQNTKTWRNNAYFEALHAAGTTQSTAPDGSVVKQLVTTANRYNTGLSIGYKFNPRHYAVTTVRYDHDNLGDILWQGAASVGYGYIALNSASFDLSFELGPGIKRYQPNDTKQNNVTVHPAIRTQGVARGLVDFLWHINTGVTLQNTSLVEAGNTNTYWQNDLSVSVSMTKKLSLKVSHQVQYNTHVIPGYLHTNMLTSTNIVYNF